MAFQGMDHLLKETCYTPSSKASGASFNSNVSIGTSWASDAITCGGEGATSRNPGSGRSPTIDAKYIPAPDRPGSTLENGTFYPINTGRSGAPLFGGTSSSTPGGCCHEETAGSTPEASSKSGMAKPAKSKRNQGSFRNKKLRTEQR